MHTYDSVPQFVGHQVLRVGAAVGGLIALQHFNIPGEIVNGILHIGDEAKGGAMDAVNSGMQPPIK